MALRPYGGIYVSSPVIHVSSQITYARFISKIIILTNCTENAAMQKNAIHYCPLQKMCEIPAGHNDRYHQIREVFRNFCNIELPFRIF